MFFEKLKRQYFVWCLFAGSLGASNIIENVRAFDLRLLLVNAFMVLALAFLCYCIAYCVCAVLSLLGINLPKFLSLLLIALVLFSVMPVPESQANAKEAAKQGAKKVLIFIATVIGYDKADDAWDATEGWLNDKSHRVGDAVGDAADDVWDFIVSDNTPECDECKSGCSSCEDDEEYTTGYNQRGSTPPDSSSSSDGSSSDGYTCSKCGVWQSGSAMCITGGACYP